MVAEGLLGVNPVGVEEFSCLNIPQSENGIGISPHLPVASPGWATVLYLSVRPSSRGEQFLKRLPSGANHGMFKLLDSNDFVKQVQDVVYSGCGMNPLVGSGASAASGIIMGQDFSDYLANVVRRTIQPEGAWDLRMNDWPSYPTSKDYSDTRTWTLKTFKDLYDRAPFRVEVDGHKIKSIQTLSRSLSDRLNCPGPPANIRSSQFVPDEAALEQVNEAFRRGKHHAAPYEPLWLKPEQSPTSVSWITEVGLRSLADWRSTLHFLSRLKKDKSGRVTLTQPNPSVVDRFNTFITADRQPNLAHKMLAALARPLRMRTVLTTNFDTLSEEAFTQSGHQLKKFFVSRYGHLPDPFLVRAQPSILKLHGELLETRADYSLDADPSPAEKSRFLRYFVDTEAGSEEFRSMLSHVLVLGYSGNDTRTIRLLQYLLDETAHFRPENQPKIFWICVSDGDVWRVRTFFSRYPAARIVACQTDRPDLLLLKLYQKVVRAIPVAGQTYEYNHNVPPSRTGKLAPLSLLVSSSGEIQEEAIKSFNQLDEHDENSVHAVRDSLALLAGDMLYRRLQGTFDPASVQQPSHQIYEHVQICDLPGLVRNIRVGLDKIKHQETPPDVIVNDKNKETNKRQQYDTDNEYWSNVDIQCAPTGRILFFESACSALEALSVLYAKLSRCPGKQCLWFELADYINGDALLRDILRSIALRTGRFQREHVTLHPLDKTLATLLDEKPRFDVANELKTYFTKLCEINQLTLGDWPILLYGRDLPGSCVNWESCAWKKETWNELFVLLGALAMAGFPVLLAHSSETRLEGEEDKQRKALDKVKGHVKDPHTDAERLQRFEEGTKTELPLLFQEILPSARRDSRLSIFHRISDRLFDRCLQDPGYRKFLYAVCLFRQSRRPSALFYEAVQPCQCRFNRNGIDNDVRRFRYAEDEIEKLEDEYVFYVKAGGSSWMHRDIRIALKKMLDQVSWKEPKKNRKYWHSESAGRKHFWIGDWYEKAFYSTGFAKPVFEALHHYYQAARWARFALPKGLIKDKPEDDEKLKTHRYLLMRSALNAISKLLIVARPSLKLWMANLHGFPMFDSLPECCDQPSRGLEQWLCPNDSLSELLTETQATELGICYGNLHSVVRDTQLAIQNEANIQISPGLAPGILDLSPMGTGLYAQYQQLLNDVYGAGEEWNDKSETLVADIMNAFGGSESKLGIKVWQSCLPIGNVAAPIGQDEHAKNKGQIVAALGEKLDKLPEFISMIEAIAYAQMRRAKFCGHTISVTDQEQSWRHHAVRDEWLRVTRLCNLGVDWCKHLPPSALKLDLETRIRLHSYYAVALANLDRFYEAHRHLTEALALQSKHLWAAPRLEQAKLSLRRAEVILTEAHRVGHVLRLFSKKYNLIDLTQIKRTKELIDFLKDNGLHPVLKDNVQQSERSMLSDPDKDGFLQVELHQSIRECLEVGQDNATLAIQKLRRLLVAMLDDAWFAIENAERGLSGQTQSSLWWGRVALMKLRACGYQSNLWLSHTTDTGDKVYHPITLMMIKHKCTPDKGKGTVKVYQPPMLMMLAYRHRRINPQGIWRMYETAQLNDHPTNPESHYRKYRLVRYLAQCFQVFAHCQDEVDFVQERCNVLQENHLKPEDTTGGKTPHLKALITSAEKAVEDALTAAAVR